MIGIALMGAQEIETFLGGVAAGTPPPVNAIRWAASDLF